MLRIRLSRTGKIRQPSYRVVVAEKESKRDGRIVENIGHYNPLPNPAEFQIKEDRALYWLSVGAQPSDAVRILLEKQGTYDRLSRYRAGESLDSLVTEYTGVAPVAIESVKAVEAEAPALVEDTAEVETSAIADEVEDVVETVVDKTEDVAAAAADQAEDVVETVVDKTEDVVEAAVDKVEDVAETVVEEAEDVVDEIEAVIDADEEE